MTGPDRRPGPTVLPVVAITVTVTVQHLGPLLDAARRAVRDTIREADRTARAVYARITNP